MTAAPTVLTGRSEVGGSPDPVQPVNGRHHAAGPGRVQPVDASRAAGRWSAVVALALGAVLNGCAALALHRVLPLGRLLPVVAVASLGPALLSGLLALPRRTARQRAARGPTPAADGPPRTGRAVSLWLAAPLTAVAWTLVASVTILRSDAVFAVLPSAATLRDIGTGLRDSWAEVLGTILPAPADPRLLAAVSAPVWLASAASAELVLRTRSALLPVLPPLLVFAGGLLLGMGGPGSNLAVAVCFVALAAGLLLARRREPLPARALLRAYATGLPMVACVALVAALAGPRLPVLSHRKQFDLRRYVQTADQPRTGLNPLDQVSAWLATTDLALFTVTGPAAQLWRIASLDAFDGQTWRSTGRFVPTSSRVPVPPGAPARSSRLAAEVTIQGLTGLWLPAAESPTAVTGTPIVVDPDTGVLLSRTGLSPGLRYEVTAQLPEYGADQLRLAPPAGDDEAKAALALPPGLPGAIVDEAQLATEGATFPAQQAARLESYLRTTERNDPTAPPGHTYGHLAYFLTVSHRGTTEQFAAAFAVMARSLGLPTRLVVGFAGGLPDAAGSIWTVRGGDVLVWPEVDFQGVGWVPFFPTPVAGSSADGTTPAPAGATSQRQQIDQHLNAAPVTQVQPPATNMRGRSGDGGSAKARSWWLLLLVLPTTVAGYLGTVLVVPFLRARRRRAVRGGAGQIAAAWAELMHRLGPLRLGDVAALTAGEVAVTAACRLDREAGAHLGRLAVLADAAAFSGAPLADSYGAAAWRHVEAASPAIRQAAGVRARLRHRLGPRVLRR